MDTRSFLNGMTTPVSHVTLGRILLPDLREKNPIKKGWANIHLQRKDDSENC
jgi:hypothetical protein